MKIETHIVFTRDEVNSNIPYALVAETMSGSRWGTRKCKQLMKEWFTESEIKRFREFYLQARNWYLIKGVPDEVRMTGKTLALWHKLAEFCCQI